MSERETIDLVEADLWSRANSNRSTSRLGDVVMPGAFTKTLMESGGQVPLLWQHAADRPIGIARLKDSSSGLIVDGQIDMDTAEGRRAHSA